MFRGHIGCQTSYQRKFDRIVEEIPVHIRMTQKDKVIGDDSIRIHQNNAIGFFVNRLKVDSHMVRHPAARHDAVWHDAAKTHGSCSHI